MGTTTQGFAFKLVANGLELDLFEDEVIYLSDNITGLFDVGTLPSDFTRQIQLPGTKRNNQFFEQVYDISTLDPHTFKTNVKIDCYMDFDGLYLAQGYMQLNGVNLLQNKWVSSYDVSVYGQLSSFNRDMSRLLLTDMSADFASYDHTSSMDTIFNSWDFELFGGEIVYPMAEYGQQLIYNKENLRTGIDSFLGGLFVQDYKPAIRLKTVWDKIFDRFGYTYSGSFWEEPWLNNVYMSLNNELRYPIYEEANLEIEGQIKIGPTEDQTDTLLLQNNITKIPYTNTLYNPAGSWTDEGWYTIDLAPTRLRGKIGLNILVEGTAGNIVPILALYIQSRNGVGLPIPLTDINTFFAEVREDNISQNVPTGKKKYFLEMEWNSSAGLPFAPNIDTEYDFWLAVNTLGTGTLSLTLDPDGERKGYIEVTKQSNLGEGWMLNIAKNMPFGTDGITCSDFIRGVQKKFNLIIYPSKIKRKEFVVETFNKWYKDGNVIDFNPYINLDETLSVVPANNLAVNQLNFGDTLDSDYAAQLYNKEVGREFGKEYYKDTENFFSQGNFEVKSGFASSPLVYMNNTGVSGEPDLSSFEYLFTVKNINLGPVQMTCDNIPYTGTRGRIIVNLLTNTGVPTINTGGPVGVTIKFVLDQCWGGDVVPRRAVEFVTLNIPFGDSIVVYDYMIEYQESCRYYNVCSILETVAECVSTTSMGTAIIPAESDITICTSLS